MTPTEFRELRRKLGLTQTQLAAVMGYGVAGQSRISEIEGGETVPAKAARLMEVYASGWRPGRTRRFRSRGLGCRGRFKAKDFEWFGRSVAAVRITGSPGVHASHDAASVRPIERHPTCA